MDGAGVTVETTPPGEDGSPNNLVLGLAIGIPCGLIIVILVVLICVMICLTTCNSSEEEAVESMYMRRRFQGLSLEEQRRRQKNVKAMSKFVSRRRSSAATGSKHSTIHLAPNSRGASRVIKANPFGLQEWQLKLSGIDIVPDGDTEETELDNESPRSPIGAINPLLLQYPQDQVQPSYEPVQRSQQVSQSSSIQHQAATTDSDGGGSSDSFNPYD